MKPLIVLLGTFCISLLIIFLINGQWQWDLPGRIAMAAMLLFTAMGHFAFNKGMVMMMPGFVPFKKQIVYLTGVFEIAAAAGLLFHNTFHLASWALIVFFILAIPANINAAIKKVDYQKATNSGHGLNYLWFRVPLQILFILWIFYFGLH